MMDPLQQVTHHLQKLEVAMGMVFPVVGGADFSCLLSCKCIHLWARRYLINSVYFANSEAWKLIGKNKGYFSINSRLFSGGQDVGNNLLDLQAAETAEEALVSSE